MGPVMGQLWRSEKDNGIAIEDAVLDEAVLNTVGYVVSRYGALTGSDLERLTPSEDPWIDADFRRDKGRAIRIRIETMAGFFRGNGADDEDREIQPDPSELQSWLS